MSLSLQRALETAIDGEVRFDRFRARLYSTDASVYQIEPLGVVIPRSAEAVVRAIALAAQHGVSITPRGGGTSQAGQSIGSGIVLDTSKYLNRVLEINPDERWARVEPGVVLDELNAALRPHNLRFAPDVSSASRATVGGMMANNSSGARSVLYGKTIDHVLEQRVVLSDGALAHFRPLDRNQAGAAIAGDGIEARAYRAIPELGRRHAGEIERRFPKVLRRVGGYNLDAFVDPSRPVDLTRIMIGSEGTLGFIVDAKIKLVPLPAQKSVLTIEFDQLLDALGATPAILKHGPSAVEVMDDFILSHAKSHPALDLQRRAMITADGSALLCVEFYGDSIDELEARMTGVERDLQSQRPRQMRQVIDPQKQQAIWSFREAALGLSTAMKTDGKAISFVEDTAVAPEKLRDYIERFIGIVRRHHTTAGVYAHASVGCLHVRPVVNLKTADGVAKFEAIANEVADLVLEFGGALSGEHGDGLVRGAFNQKMFGSELYQAFREVKKTFDPNGLFNPGRIVDTPPITSHLRYGAGYATPSPATFFDFSDHDGFGRAVEMCSGVGLCRKKREGTMCPSYMVTREEAHSTRGRANTLRLAMAGQLGDAKLSDQGVHDVLDLCLECRACKSECPVGVDVARFKSEFLCRLLGSPRHVAGRAGLRRRAGRRRLGQPLRAILERGRQHEDRALGRREAHRHRSAAIAAAMDAADAAEADQGSGSRDRGSGESRTALRRHLYESRRSGDRPCGDRRDERGRHRDARRTQCLLRPSADFAGPSVGRAPARRGQRSRALRRGAPRPRHRVRRTELPVGGP